MELTGQAGKRHQKQFVRDNGMGHMRTAVPKKHWRLPPAGEPYAVDNGKFGADTKGRPWDENEFLEVLGRIPKDRPPLFVVCPDLVFKGNDSLRFSSRWRESLEILGFGWMTWYLAVQDGMSEDLVARELQTGRWGGVLVGGSRPFKFATLDTWIRICRPLGLKVHVGGIGRPETLAWARSRGADSCDYTGWARNDAFHMVSAGRQQQVLVRPHRVSGECPTCEDWPPEPCGNLEVAADRRPSA